MAPVSIRGAEVGDLDLVVALRRAMRREERAAVGPTMPDDPADLVALTRSQLGARGQRFFVAFAGDEAVGLLRCALVRGDPAPAAMLTTAWVAPSHRRRGILRTLVETATSWCAARDVHDLRVRVYTANAGADRAWAALGFDTMQHIRRRVVPPPAPSPAR